MNITIRVLQERVSELLEDLDFEQLEEYRRLCHVYHNDGWSSNGWYFDVSHSMRQMGCPEELAHRLASNIDLRLSK